MNIAIVGAGRRCRAFLEAISRCTFEDLELKVVAIADKNEDALCVRQALKHGILFTKDYNDLFERNDIDLIVELTGDRQVFNDILQKKKKSVRAFDHRTAQLFWELNRISAVQERTEQELVKAKSLYNIFINELMEEDLMIISPSYQILDLNETLSSKLGFKPKELIGRYCYEISHHQDAPCEGSDHPCPLRQTLRTGKPSQTTHVHRGPKGNELFYSISCHPIFEDGEIVAVVEISKDITKDINMQRRMMQQQKLVSIGRLAAGIAHEINNPMTTILTTAMLIQEDLDSDDPIYKELQTIVDETLRCRKIVDNLLDFARQTKPSKEKNDINKIVMETINLTKKEAAFKDIRLGYDLAENLPLVHVDKGQIQQAMINLAINAIEATEGGGKVTFTTRLASSGEAIEIIVSDTGKGIAEEDTPRIFEPFFTTKETGTGLGLAITHGLIEQHGGTIDVKSRMGEGTTFTIRLPIKKGEEDVH